MKYKFSTVLVAIVLTGCVQESSPDSSETAANKDGTTTRKSGATTSRPSAKKIAATARLDDKIYDHFGDGIAAMGETITLATLVEKSKELVGKKVRLTGDVKSVCKTKGCWMVLADGSMEVRIKFRDYGFFMPKDCEGRTAILEGTFDVSETSVADLKHLLEDEGKTEEAAMVTEPRLEMNVTADGVALKKK